MRAAARRPVFPCRWTIAASGQVEELMAAAQPLKRPRPAPAAAAKPRRHAARCDAPHSAGYCFGRRQNQSGPGSRSDAGGTNRGQALCRALPRMARAHGMSMLIPRRPPMDGRRIAVVISGMGLSEAPTRLAVQRLPAPVSLAFTPYGETFAGMGCAGADRRA